MSNKFIAAKNLKGLGAMPGEFPCRFAPMLRRGQFQPASGAAEDS